VEDSTSHPGKCWSSASDAVSQTASEHVSVTPVLVFRAVAQQRDMTRLGQPHDEAQGEFLSVILDAAAARIDQPVSDHLVLVHPDRNREGTTNGHTALPRRTL
jgi:hypothetical protein